MRPWHSAALWSAVCVLWCAPRASAQLPNLVAPDGAPLPRAGITLGVDGDDDDEDGWLDSRQSGAVPAEDLYPVRLLGPVSGPVEVAVDTDLRLIVDGTPAPAGRLTIARSDLPYTVWLQGSRASLKGHPSSLRIATAGQSVVVPVHVFGLAFLDAENQPIDARRHTVGVSLRVTNDLSLPRGRAPEIRSPDHANIRVELFDSRITADRVEITLQSVEPGSGRVRDEQPLVLTRYRAGEPHRSRFVRLVGDGIDARAAGVTGQLLRVALRDRVRARRKAPGERSHHDLRVGRPGNEDHEASSMRVRARVVVLRAFPGGPPVIGDDERSALEIVRAQLGVANDVWLQCHIGFGPPSELEVLILDPPPPSLLAIADGDGLPAAGDGQVSFRIDDVIVGPVRTVRGARPVDTAVDVLAAVESAGFYGRVTVNPRTNFGTDLGADLVITGRSGAPVVISEVPGTRAGSDSRQSVSIGSVDLGDGLSEFDNMTARSGTLEERALLKGLMDDDPASIDIFVVNRFTRGSRQGEAFIEASAGSVVNALILDRNGVRHQETAWTLAHEIGHVLLDEALHPDNLGPDRPWMLMDSDSSRGTVLGPKRLTVQECLRARYESGVDAEPALMTPHDPRPLPYTPDPAPFEH